MNEPITFFIKNPQLHVMALSADGFYEEASKKGPEKGKVRRFTKVHHEGLLIETQHVDTSPSSPDPAPGNQQFLVEISLKLDGKALAQITEKLVQMKTQSSDPSAFLSEYRNAIELLKKFGPQLKETQPPDAKAISEFLAAISSLSP